MTTKNPDFIERTVQKTCTWLASVAQGLEVDDRQRAYHVLRAVLHAIRDRLSVDDAAALSAQLPVLIRGVYYEGWHPAGKPLHIRDPEEFLALIGQNLASDGELAVDPARALTAVANELRFHMDSTAFDSVVRAMPRTLHPLFD